LSRFQLLRAAVAWTLGPCASFQRIREDKSAVPLSANGQPRGRPFANSSSAASPFDLALIDGDHSEAGCWEDFPLVRGKASVLAFHDIVSDAVPGVGAVWRKVQQTCANEYDFFEFTAQYPSVARRTGQRFLGIGVAVPKRLAAQAAERLILGSGEATLQIVRICESQRGKFSALLAGTFHQQP
jgi:hypothetical protein